MKTILLWDPRFPDRRPARLTVEDTVASAAVRAGVAAAANPAEAGALSAGGALDPTMLTEVVLQHGNGGATRRVFLPYSVVLVGALAGVLASIGTPIPAGVTPTPSPTPTVAMSSAQAKAEGNSGATLFTYTVTRSATAGAVSVPWSFTPGSTSADDFTGGIYPAGGNVNLADGAASGTFSVSVSGDTVVEGDETFTVMISTPAGYVAGVATSATGTILNDDVSAGTPTIAFAVASAYVTEGNSGTNTVSNTINVTRNGVTGPLSINLTYGGTATSGTDYVAGPVSVTIADGVNSASFDLTINGDTAVEPDETIIITAALSGYSATASKTITIGNDDVTSGSTTSVPVSDRAWVPTNTASIANNQTSRREHNAPPQGAITNLKFIDLGWYIATAGHVPASSSAYTIKKFVEYPAGTFTQVTWSGATSVAVGVGLQQTSDPVAITIPAGAKYWERTVQISGAAATMPVLELPAGSSAIGASDGNSLSDLGNSGTISPTSGIATIGSAAIIGDIAAANVRTFVVQGDSIAFGEGDISSVGANMSSGWISRGLAGQFAHVRIAKRGQAASEVAGNASNAMVNFIASLGNYTDIIFELGINDVTAGRTQAQILADQQTLYGKFPAGVRKWQTTLTPRTSSTNSYADAAGQTVKTDGSMGSLLSINAAIRAKPSGVFGVIDASDYASTARDSGIWSGPFPPTTDGTHPTSAKAAAMSALLTVPTS